MDQERVSNHSLQKYNDQSSNKGNEEVFYKVEDVPSVPLCLLYGFQHYVSMFVGSLSVPFLLSAATCMGEDNLGKTELIGTLFLCCGLITLLQIGFGVRLPIIQAGTFSLLSPTLSYLSLPQFECPPLHEPGANQTSNSSIEIGSPEHREIWQSRLREIQGSLMVAAIFEVVIGFSGAMGFLMRYIGPLSICPTIALLGISLFRSAADYAAPQWWICIMTICLMVIFSQYIAFLRLPCPVYNKQQGCHKTKYPIFKMFPVILSIGVAWLICYILTVTDDFPNDPNEWGYGARTDVRSDVIYKAPWFRFPYPGQWGKPVVSVSLTCGLLAGLMASMVESVGDYHACAKLSGVTPPPTHAINRGIGMEGIGCIIAGAFGTGNGTTSTSINVGVIAITKMGSRRAVVYSAVMMICFAVINKFGALFVTIPDPIIGGSFFILFGMIVAVGISNLQYVDMNSSRNLFIFGLSFFTGLSVSEWIKLNPHAINTGNQTADNVFTVLLSTSMFLGGVIGFILDNTIKGTPQERGILRCTNSSTSGDITSGSREDLSTCYHLPFNFGNDSKKKLYRYTPFCPAYGTVETKIELDEVNPDTQQHCYDGPFVEYNNNITPEYSEVTKI